MRPLVVGSRGSALALWQTEHVIGLLRAAHPGIELRVEVIKTQGDKILDVALSRIGDRGLFVKELEEAMFDGRIDFAVHSLKDLPTTQPEGLAIAAVLERADVRDVLVPRAGTSVQSLADLGPGAVIGTSSLRRRTQLAARYPAFSFLDVRGNLQTRLDKLDRGDYDALVLAAAGLDRLGLGGRIAQRLDTETCLPAVGQGALAVEARADDPAVAELLKVLEHGPTRACVTAERAFLRELEGGCQVPIGALGRLDGDEVVLQGVVADLQGQRVLRAEARGRDGLALGKTLAGQLLASGAREVLEAVRKAAEQGT